MIQILNITDGTHVKDIVKSTVGAAKNNTHNFEQFVFVSAHKYIKN